jgi:hypothetical protein
MLLPSSGWKVFKLSFLTIRLAKVEGILLPFLFCFDYSAPSVIAQAVVCCGMKK